MFGAHNILINDKYLKLIRMEDYLKISIDDETTKCIYYTKITNDVEIFKNHCIINNIDTLCQIIVECTSSQHVDVYFEYKYEKDAFDCLLNIIIILQLSYGNDNIVIPCNLIQYSNSHDDNFEMFKLISDINNKLEVYEKKLVQLANYKYDEVEFANAKITEIGKSVTEYKNNILSRVSHMEHKVDDLNNKLKIMSDYICTYLDNVPVLTTLTRQYNRYTTRIHLICDSKMNWFVDGDAIVERNVDKLIKDMPCINSLTLEGAGITSLEFLKYNKRIIDLRIRNCPNLKTLHGIEFLKNLMKLHLFHVKNIQNLEPLINLDNLQQLFVSDDINFKIIKSMMYSHKYSITFLNDQTEQYDF